MLSPLRAEHDDRRANIAKVDRRAVGSLDPACRKIIADEQFIDDELDFLGVQVDVTAPPAFEAEITRGLGVDLGIEIVLFAPQRIRWILVLEILHQPAAIKLAVTEVAGKRGEPAAAQQAAACSASDTCRARRPNRKAVTPRR